MSNSQKPSNPKDLVGVCKAPMSTVSAPVLAEVGVAMLEGALKYGRHNYRAVGVRASIYYDATMRHLMGWWEGQDIDPDSGMSHITKAITSLVVLRDAMIQGELEDDRPPASPEFYTELNQRVEELMELYKHCAPKHYTIQDTKRKTPNIPDDILTTTFAPLESLVTEEDWETGEARMTAIGQNGNTGEHYLEAQDQTKGGR